MISIVCVYNNAQVLRDRLLHSLDLQAVSCELSDVDNRESRFQNAAAALNCGAAQTRGDWLLFAHPEFRLVRELKEMRQLSERARCLLV